MPRKQFSSAQSMIQTQTGQWVTMDAFQQLVDAGREKSGMYTSETLGIGAALQPIVSTSLYDKLKKTVEHISLLTREHEQEAKQTLLELEPESQNNFTLVLCLMWQNDPGFAQSFRTMIKLFHSAGLKIDTESLIHFAAIMPMDYLHALLTVFDSDIASLQTRLGTTLVMSVIIGLIERSAPIQDLRRTISLLDDANFNHVHSTQGALLHQIIARKPSSEMFQALMECILTQTSLDFTVRDREKNTPLLLAVKMQQTHLMIILLKFMKNLNAGLNATDDAGRTPVMCSALLGNQDITRILLSKGAKINLSDHNEHTLAWYLTENLESMLAQHHITSKSHPYLLDANKMPITWTDNTHAPNQLIPYQTHSLSIMHDAAKAMGPMHQKCIQEQINALEKTEVTAVRYQKHRQGSLEYIRSLENKLRLAVVCGSTRDVERYLAQGVDVNACDEHNRSPLHFAAMRSELTQPYLYKHNQRSSALKLTREVQEAIKEDMQKAMQNRYYLADLLLEKGADPKQKNRSGNSFLDLILRDKASSNALNQKTADSILRMLRSKYPSLVEQKQTASSTHTAHHPK